MLHQPPEITELSSLILDNIPLLVAYLDKNQRYFYANVNYQQWIGKEQHHIIGQTKRAVIGDTAYQQVSPYIQRVLRGELVKFEDSIMYANGRQRYVHVTYVPHLSSKKEVLGFFSFIRDITERKLNEIQLAKQEERLQNIIDSTPGIVWEISLNKQKQNFSLEYISAYAETLLGYPMETWYKTPDLWGKTIHPEDRERVKAQLLEIVKNKSTNSTIQFRFITQDDDIITTEARCSVIFNHQPAKVVGVRGVTLDITKRKKAEDALQFLSEASKILSTSLDYQITLNQIAKLSVPMFADWCAVDLLNRDGQVDLVAVAHRDPKKVRWAKKLRQTRPIQLDVPNGVGKVITAGVPEFYPIITEEMIKASSPDKKTYDLIMSLGFCSIIIVPLIVQGKSVGAISFVTTDSRRHYDQADFSTAQELAHRASVAVENATLYKESLEAVQLRDEFLSIASHELKTPVTSLKLYTQMLRKKMKDDPLASYVQKMEKQVDKLTHLIVDLLTVSKIEFGHLTFTKEFFDFSQLIDEVTQHIQQTTDHQLIIKNPTLPPLYGDRERIGQILINLLTNAIKYSPTETPIQLRAQQTDGIIDVKVKDKGIGIDAVNHEKIFDRFYQVNEPTEKTYPGLGIGLYLSRQIARNHGGDITVQSQKGRGSTFTLTLPVKNGSHV